MENCSTFPLQEKHREFCNIMKYGIQGKTHGINLMGVTFVTNENVVTENAIPKQKKSC